MVKNKIISIVMFCFVITGYAQSNALEKKLEKANALIEKEKFDQADEYLEKLLSNYPSYGDAWDLLAKVRAAEYKQAKELDKLNLFGGNITVVSKDKDGNEIKEKNDSLVDQLKEILSGIKASDGAYEKYIYTIRKALLLSNDALACSFYIRNLKVDEEIDKDVPKKALKFYNEAESEFSNKNYALAAKLYKRALEEKPDFYKARLYLGDVYYFTGNYVDAISTFKEATEKFPHLLEAHKYLVDAYAKEKLYEKALEEAIVCASIYPDLSMMHRIDYLATYVDKKVDIKWTQRQVFPNKIEDKDSTSKKFKTTPYEDKYKVTPEAFWKLYVDAKDKIKDNCDSQGVIIKPTTLTTAKYLEVYSWEQMLLNSSDTNLKEAKRMMDDGYLDCYVFVTCFHYDFYDQYKHFANNNRQRIIDYFNKYVH